jgi:L-threonylcarbamoyladenylate synthase
LILEPTQSSLAAAARALRGGDLVAFPTETVYGLGADAGNVDAIARLYAVKGRPTAHPVIVHVQDMTAAEQWARDLPEGARRLGRAFWPGPLTLIVPRAPHVSLLLTGGQDSVGIRVPAHPVAQALLAAFAALGGSGIAAPSANRFGRISPTTAQHVADDLGDDVSAILDGGACAVGVESTIVAFAGTTPMLLRPGGIAADALARVLGEVPRAAPPDAPRASGTLDSHYAPHTPMRFVATDALAQAALRGAAKADVAVMARTLTKPPAFGGLWIAADTGPERYAQKLYANLRLLDAAGAREILVEEIPTGTMWDAVRDRLNRAVSKVA